MLKSSNKYSVSQDLYQITERDVNLLDQEVADGEGWKSYFNGQIVKATVLGNQISGICYDRFQEFFVEIRVNQGEISGNCTCGKYGKLCSHVVALLYSWINDGDAFMNVGNSLLQLQNKNKEELIEVITRIMVKNPQNIFLLNGSDPTEDDVDDTEGMFN